MMSCVCACICVCGGEEKDSLYIMTNTSTCVCTEEYRRRVGWVVRKRCVAVRRRENENEYKKSRLQITRSALWWGEVIENMSNYFLRFMWSSTQAENVSNTCLETRQKKKKMKIKKRKKGKNAPALE